MNQQKIALYDQTVCSDKVFRLLAVLRSVSCEDINFLRFQEANFNAKSFLRIGKG